MFREMRRAKQQLTKDECIRILKENKRCVLAVLGDSGYPYAIPLNYFYDETSGKIYFHGAKSGHKIDALHKNSKVSFCTYDNGYIEEGDWAYTVKSVIIIGRIRFIESHEETINLVRKLALKYYPTAEEVEKEIEKDGKFVQVLELTIEHISGKRIHAK